VLGYTFRRQNNITFLYNLFCSSMPAMLKLIHVVSSVDSNHPSPKPSTQPPNTSSRYHCYLGELPCFLIHILLVCVSNDTCFVFHGPQLGVILSFPYRSFFGLRCYPHHDYLVRLLESCTMYPRETPRVVHYGKWAEVYTAAVLKIYSCNVTCGSNGCISIAAR
jgi:hypothetical protein